jgi:thiamine biosynthesis lipoprotein
MGTVLEIEAFGGERKRTEEAVSAAFREVEEVERRLSNWREDSELSRANTVAARAPVALSRETWWSLFRALVLARETQGAFDPTVGAVTEALGLTGAVPDPTRARIEAVGWRNALLDPASRTLRFAVSGAAIDSGGFAKGEALDRALAALRRRGVRAARLNFGGQIAVAGSATLAGVRARLGRVGVADPRAGSRREIARFNMGDGSVSTSGVSERPGHLLDPRTGVPAPFSGSVTVVADTALRADALSTALFVMGPRVGLAFAEARGVAALYLLPAPTGWTILASRAFPPVSRLEETS